MTATLATVDVELGDECLTARLGTLELLFLLIRGWMSAKELEGQILILLSLLLSQRLQPLQLDEGLRAITPASVEHACYDHNAVYLSSG